MPGHMAPRLCDKESDGERTGHCSPPLSLEWAPRLTPKGNGPGSSEIPGLRLACESHEAGS